MTQFRKGAAMGLTGALVAAGIVVAAAPAQASTGVQPLLDTSVAPAPAYAQGRAPALTVAGGAQSSVAKSGKALVVTLAAPDLAELSAADGTTTNVEPAKLAKAWTAALGSNARGVLAGVTAAGRPVSIPATFGAPKLVKGKVVVTATPKGGVVDASVREYMKIASVSAGTTSGKFKALSVFAERASSKMWHFGAAAATATVTGSSTVTVKIKGGTSGSGVQPNGRAASIEWADLVAGKAKLAKGAPARLAVSGLGRDGKALSLFIRPTDYALANGVLTVTGTPATRLTPAGIKNAAQMKAAAVALDVSNPAHTTSYVVITGDSISSGEAGRYASEYLGAPDGVPVLYDGIETTRGFCALIDLACTGVTVEDGVTKYDYDLSKAYEPGSQPVDEGGNGCDVSVNAPGTWLANYFAEVKRTDIESINLACSGATTNNVKFGGSSFKGQGPQADRLQALTTWLSVPYVTNTMGANDIRFADIAMACFLAPVEALGFEINLPKNTGTTRGLDVLGMIEGAGGLIEQDWNPGYNTSAQCSQKYGTLMGQAEALLVAMYGQALRDLTVAAPDSKIVAMNYPNLVPSSDQSNTSRRRAFEHMSMAVQHSSGIIDQSTMQCDLPESCGTLQGPFTMEQLTNGIPGYKPFPKENLRQLASDVLMNLVTLGGGPLLQSANLMFSPDADWAANVVIPKIDEAIYRVASGMGPQVIPVDQRELFNGRQLASRYVSTDAEMAEDLSLGKNDAVTGNSNQLWRYTQIKEDGSGLMGQPNQVRSSFVTSPFAGLAVPVLCHNRATLSLNGSALEDEGSDKQYKCIGNMQEALHPNVRGQAAQGQCIVAVVTGMVGEGNACVRSIGDNEAKPARDRANLMQFEGVEGVDTLCVVDKPRQNFSNDMPSDCSGKIWADPVWSAAKWEKNYLTKVPLPTTAKSVYRHME